MSNLLFINHIYHQQKKASTKKTLCFKGEKLESVNSSWRLRVAEYRSVGRTSGRFEGLEQQNIDRWHLVANRWHLEADRWPWRVAADWRMRSSRSEDAQQISVETHNRLDASWGWGHDLCGGLHWRVGIGPMP